MFRQVTRSIREFTPEQLEFLANIVRLYRGETPEFEAKTQTLLDGQFPGRQYRDVPGLCKVATLAEIEAQDWSLNPGRYVGVGTGVTDEYVFAERLEELNEQLESLNTEARALEAKIASNIGALLAGA